MFVQVPQAAPQNSNRRNIVICCDGTGNEYGDRNSNVVKLYRMLIKYPGAQITYYHPGVGTMGAKNALSASGKLWTKLRGLTFGYGLSENIADAYQFLMQSFTPGDRVFVFGFSRGAYTARALCGLLQMFGLLSTGNEGLIPYALRLFKRTDAGVIFRLRQVFGAPSNKYRTAAGFKKTFCRECEPHFLGLWDTVSSVGWILDPIGLKPGHLPYTYSLKEVPTIRHAVSVDERRAFFRQNLVSKDPKRDIKEVWFAGVHSDVGGSYPEEESGLSKISLRWMLREAKLAGLLVDDDMATKILGVDLSYACPSCNAILHNSLTPAWWLGEFWPKWTKRRLSPPGQIPEQFRGWPRLNLFRRRTIRQNARIHQSVFDRQTADPEYHPRNMPHDYTIEDETSDREYPMHLEPGQQAVVGIHAALKRNDTGIHCLKGEKYHMQATGRWYDDAVNTGPDGYASPNFLFRALQWLRRTREANWFALIGVIETGKRTAFVIGNGIDLQVDTDGVLNCYANDLPFMYGNNSGHVKLTVTRLR